MSMSRKHFEAIANSVHASRRVAGTFISDENTIAQKAYQLALDNVAYELAGKMESFNPIFDRQRFLEACGAPCD